MKLDIVTGNEIVPETILYQHGMLLDNGEIEIYAYPLEQIIGGEIQTKLLRSSIFGRRFFYCFCRIREKVILHAFYTNLS